MSIYAHHLVNIFYKHMFMELLERKSILKPPAKNKIKKFIHKN